MFYNKKYRHGAGIIFYKKEGDNIYIALGLRKVRPNAGYWSFAGGQLDKTDNSYLDCALREAREEFFNSNFEPINAIKNSVSKPFKKIRFNLYFIRWDAYFINITNIDIKFEPQRSEIIEIKWFPINDLPLKTHRLIPIEIFIARILCFF